MTKLCAMPGCINELSAHARLPTCANCRNGLRYWDHKRPAERLERRRKLRMYDARIGTMVPDAEVAAYIRRKRND